MIETDTMKSSPDWSPDEVYPWTGKMCLEEQRYLYKLKRKRYRREARKLEKELRQWVEGHPNEKPEKVPTFGGFYMSMTQTRYLTELAETYRKNETTARRYITRITKNIERKSREARDE